MSWIEICQALQAYKQLAHSSPTLKTMGSWQKDFWCADLNSIRHLRVELQTTTLRMTRMEMTCYHDIQRRADNVVVPSHGKQGKLGGVVQKEGIPISCMVIPFMWRTQELVTRKLQMLE